MMKMLFSLSVIIILILGILCIVPKEGKAQKQGNLVVVVCDVTPGDGTLDGGRTLITTIDLPNASATDECGADALCSDCIEFLLSIGFQWGSTDVEVVGGNQRAFLTFTRPS